MAGIKSERARDRARDLLATVYPAPDDVEFRRLRQLAIDYVQEAERLEAEKRGRAVESDELISTALDAVARDYFNRAVLRAMSLSGRRRLAFGRRALDRRYRRCPGTRPLQFNFLGDGRDRITDFVDDSLQRVSGYSQPPVPGANLSRIRHVDFIADRRMFDALHDGVPCCRFNGKP